ncbi:MAG: MATE family efflux transporter [Bacteroidetes bacterium]|nr:MATE family efflux transporter [Bacteroidota bacterium]MCA6444699.1 MATE family efflux transporter [Bacteroidota bacterium]
MGHIVTNMVDTIFLGQISPTHQAAGILAANLYTLVLVFAIGVSYVLTPLVSSAQFESDELRKANLFKNSLFLNFVIALVSFAILFLSSGLLAHMQQPKEVVVLAKPFYNVLIFSMLPVSLFFTCKQYCEGLSLTMPALYISIIGNVLNIALNYALIYGVAFFPEMGYMGSAWASFIARSFMGIAFLGYIFYSPLTNSIKGVYQQAKINSVDLLRLVKNGLNSGAQFTFEVAAFVIAGLMAGVFGKEVIDAHGIALHMAAFTYMFGSGISSATTIVVGNCIADSNWLNIKKAVRSSIQLIIVGMGSCALIFILLNKVLPYAFTDDLQITIITSKLLIIAAMFQLFDGLQVVFIGVLRGVEDFKFPTLITLIAYWVIALPLAYLLAFINKMGVYGIWYALLISLIFVALTLYLRIRILIARNLQRT